MNVLNEQIGRAFQGKQQFCWENNSFRLIKSLRVEIWQDEFVNVLFFYSSIFARRVFYIVFQNYFFWAPYANNFLLHRKLDLFLCAIETCRSTQI